MCRFFKPTTETLEFIKNATPTTTRNRKSAELEILLTLLDRKEGMSHRALIDKLENLLWELICINTRDTFEYIIFEIENEGEVYFEYDDYDNSSLHVQDIIDNALSSLSLVLVNKDQDLSGNYNEIDGILDYFKDEITGVSFQTLIDFMSKDEVEIEG